MAKLAHASSKLIPFHMPDAAVPAYVYVFSFSPEAAQARHGKLYIVFEILAREKRAKQFCELLTKQLIDAYYYNPEKDKVGDFEAAIRALNKQLRTENDDQLKTLAAGLAGVVAIIKNEDLEIAQSGNTTSILARGGKFHNIFDNQDETKKTNIFSKIAAGKLAKNDLVLLATSALGYCFDQDELAEILNTTSASKVIAAFHARLADDKNAYRCGAIVISTHEEQDLVHKPVVQEPTEFRPGQKDSVANKASRQFKPLALSALSWTKQTSGTFYAWLKTKFWPKTQQKSKNFWNILWSKYINKNPKLAAIIAVAVTLVIAFAIFGLIKPHEQAVSGYDAYKKANSAYLSAQARLSDGKKTEAAQLTQAAHDDLATISPGSVDSINKKVKKDDTITEKYSVEELSTRVSNLDDKITATERKSPTTLYEAKNGSLASLSYNDDKIYSILAGTHEILEVNINSKAVVKNATTIPVDKIISTTVDHTRGIIYFLTSDPAVWQYQIDTKTSSEVSLSSGQWTSANDIAFYNDSLYLLSPDAKQIVRYGPTAIGFGFGNSYFKTITVDPAAMLSLAINGSIFTSSSDGQFNAFKLGVQLKLTTKDAPNGFVGENKMFLNAKSDLSAGANYQKSRIYLFSIDQNSLTYDKQYALVDNAQINAFCTNPTLDQFFVVSGSKILTF